MAYKLDHSAYALKGQKSVHGLDGVLVHSSHTRSGFGDTFAEEMSFNEKTGIYSWFCQCSPNIGDTRERRGESMDYKTADSNMRSAIREIEIIDIYL